jgi:nucleoside-triphosphatase THEP1
LLTGRPGVGKTTVIKQVAAALGAGAGGFYTAEVRRAGARIGFELITLDGQRAWLASNTPQITFARGTSMGRYRVNLDAIEELGVPALLRAFDEGKIVILDEIGPMEMHSRRFCEVVLRLLDGSAPLVGTVAQRQDLFADRVKAHPRVTVRTVTTQNRDRLAGEILADLGRIG